MNDPLTEVQVLRTVIDLVRSRLPSGWSLQSGTDDSSAKDAFDDGLVLSAPDGRVVSLVVEVKRGSPSGRSAFGSAQKLHERAASMNAVPVFAARYLAAPVRDELGRLGVSFADATGNIMVSAIEPGIFLSDRGADRDPWRGSGRPRGTLRGDPAARVVRALLDYSRRWRVRDLIAASGASTGATYRVLEYLDNEGLADRGADGLWSVPSWEKLLRAWAKDFNFLVESTAGRYIDPRGIEHFQEALRRSGDLYAVTGAVASRDWTGIAPTRAVFVYVADAKTGAERWDVRRTDSSPNVVLLEPTTRDSVIFDRVGSRADGVRRVAPAQIAVDLLNGPGRDPQEAEEMLRWMSANEEVWRLE